MNQAILIGCLGRDPEFLKTKDGTSLCKFAIATNDLKDKDGKEKVEWHQIVTWGKLADLCKVELKKGKRVTVVGRIETNVFENKEKQKVKSIDVRANQVVWA